MAIFTRRPDARWTRPRLLTLMGAFLFLALSVGTTTAHASSATGATAQSPQSAAAEQVYRQQAAAGPCTDGNGFSGATQFWRCTGSSASSRFVGSSCNQGQYNAGTNYNVWGAINLCPTRVWLHQLKFPAYQSGGYAICVGPGFAGQFSVGEFPQNIMVSSNRANCTTILP